MKRTISVLLILVLILAYFSVDVFGADPDTDAGDPPVSEEPVRTGGEGENDQGPADTGAEDGEGPSDEPSDEQPGDDGDGPKGGDDGDPSDEGEDETPKAIPAEGGMLESGTYELTENLTVTGQLTVAAGSEVTIHLNGYTLTFSDKGFLNNGTLSVSGGSIGAKQYCFETNAGSSTTLSAVTVTATGYGVLVVNGGTLNCSGCSLNAKSYPVDVYDGNVTLNTCTVSSENMGVYTNQGSAGNVTLNSCTVTGKKRALNHWGNGMITAKQTTFIGGEDPCVELNRGSAQFTDHCVLKTTDGNLCKFSNSSCKFDFDQTMEFDGTWEEYHNEPWLEYVIAKYPDGIGEEHYVQNADAKLITIYSADGLAWWASRLDVKNGINENLQGYTVVLANSVDLSGHSWRFTLNGTSNFSGGVFDGGNNTISSLTVNTSHNASGTAGYGFIGDTGASSGPLTIRNVTFSGASIQGKSGSAVVFGYLSCPGTLENIRVTNSTSIGHMDGALIGWADSKTTPIKILNCSVNECNIKSTGWRAGGLVGRSTVPEIEIRGCTVSNTKIDMLFYGGGLIGNVELNSKVVLGNDNTVSGITLPGLDATHFEHTVSVDGIGNGNNLAGRNDFIIDGYYALYSGYWMAAYGEYYTKSYSTKWDAAGYIGAVGSFQRYGVLEQYLFGNSEVNVGSNNYDYTTNDVRPSVIYYAVYDDGINTRNVLYGYEYVPTGGTASGHTLFENLDCTGVIWYTDQACTQPYDMDSPVLEGITLYSPLEFHDGRGKISSERISAEQDVMPRLDNAEVPWIAKQKGVLDISVSSAAGIPDMSLRIYATYILSFDPNGGELKGPEYINVPMDGVVSKPADPNREGYRFVGWYTDAEGGEKWDFTQPVTRSATLYAHWTNRASLTIVKTNALSDQHSFIYRIEGQGYDLVVTVQGNGRVKIVDLPIGVYTVTEISSWSWRYADGGVKTVSLVEGDASVTFDNELSINYWLSGEIFHK